MTSEIVKVDINDVNVESNHSSDVILTGIEPHAGFALTTAMTLCFMGLGGFASSVFAGQPDAYLIGFSAFLGMAGGTVTVANLKADAVVSRLRKRGIPTSSQYANKLWKSFLPFQSKRSDHAYQIKSMPTEQQRMDHLGRSRKNRVGKPITYTVHRVDNGIKIYHPVVPIVVNPMKSWDKLFLDETGQNIESKRTVRPSDYTEYVTSSYFEVLVARAAMKINGERRYTPNYVEDIANTSRKECAEIRNKSFKVKR